MVPQIADLFPGSTHVKAIGLGEADDSVVWDWVKQHWFAIVSKDSNLHQRPILFGQPLKFIWLRVGDCPMSFIAMLLRSHSQMIRQFLKCEAKSLLILER